MRRDWWRLWVASRDASAFTRRSVSLTLVTGTRERTIGYRRKGYVE